MTDRARLATKTASRHPLVTGGVALFVLLIAVYVWSIDMRASWGASITGDEPFYLITTQSLIQDFDAAKLQRRQSAMLKKAGVPLPG